MQEVIAAGGRAYFEEHLADTKRLLASNDQRGFCKHLRSTVGLEGKNARSEQVIMDENGPLLRVKAPNSWVSFFHKLLKTKTLKLRLTIIELFPPRPLELSLGDEPSMDMSNWKAVGSDGLPTKILKLDHPGLKPLLSPTSFVNAWITGEGPQQWTDAFIKVLRKRRVALIATATERFRLLPDEGKGLFKTVASRLSNNCEVWGVFTT